MTKNRIIVTTILFLIFSLSVTTVMAQGGKNQKNSGPFLITGKMPHLTKLLMQQWDNPELHLSDEQKSRLLVIRKETITSVQSLGKDIGTLENQVAEGSLAGKPPETLQPLVQDIARLKVEASMVHLRCIYNTSRILDQRQLDFIKK